MDAGDGGVCERAEEGIEGRLRVRILNLDSVLQKGRAHLQVVSARSLFVL
jgi:hypothetical protein